MGIGRVKRAASDETDRRLYVTVGLVVVVGALFTVLAALDLLHNPGLEHPWLRVACFASMLVLAVTLSLQIRIKSSQQGVNTMDAVTLVGLVLVPGSWQVLLTAAVVTTVWICKRVATIKVLFNAGKDTAVAGCAVLAAYAFGPITTKPVVNLVGLAVAAGAILVADELLAIPVVAMATHTPIWKFFRTNVDVR